MKRNRSTPRRGKKASRPPCEWIGGLRTAPFSVKDEDDSFRPDVVFWVEAPSGLILAQEIVDPDDANGAVGRVLGAALERPYPGAQPAPDAVRVDDPRVVDEVRKVLGGRVPIEVAPTPEIDEVLAAFADAMGSEEPDDRSYLEEGQIEPETVARFFTAAQILHDLAPWKVATDNRVLRLDIPELDVHGACISIIGHLGESLGLLVFPSLRGYEAFGEAAEGELVRNGRIDLGTDWLAINFASSDELPPTMRREVMSNGWPLANANAYPLVERFERDGIARALDPRDFEIAIACTSAVCSMFAVHREAFEDWAAEPICESHFDKKDREVCLTLPYEAHGLFELPERSTPQAPTGKVGRNAPCPCGSGRKYKKCHMAADQAAKPVGPESASIKELDVGLVHELVGFAVERFGDEWRRASDIFDDPDLATPLLAPWFAYHHEIQGKPVVEWYLAKHEKRLSSRERSWLAAQRETWLSVWEVTEVEPGAGMTLRDLLSDETREVCDVLASQSLVVRDAILVRIVDYEGGASHICGMHPHRLLPSEAAEVVRRARGRLRRKRAVPVARLREAAIGRYLIRRWEEAIAEREAFRGEVPALSNTDGDPFLITKDHFRIAPDARSAVQAKLAAMEGAGPPDDVDGSATYHFLRPGNTMHASWDNTVIGNARFSGTDLVVETNSRERADALRARIESACGDSIHHRLREHEDPLSSKATLPESDDDPEPPSAEMEQLLLDFKQRHYATWADESLPAFGGQTPREACATTDGRHAVDVLLKDMERSEQLAAPASRFDFSGLRRSLGLD